MAGVPLSVELYCDDMISSYNVTVVEFQLDSVLCN